nr:DMT family protein [Coxiella-like endosymbiont]
MTFSVFVHFSIYYMGQKLYLNFLLAGLFLLGAIFFIFKTY